MRRRVQVIAPSGRSTATRRSVSAISWMSVVAARKLIARSAPSSAGSASCSATEHLHDGADAGHGHARLGGDRNLGEPRPARGSRKIALATDDAARFAAPGGMITVASRGGSAVDASHAACSGSKQLAAGPWSRRTSTGLVPSVHHGRSPPNVANVLVVTKRVAPARTGARRFAAVRQSNVKRNSEIVSARARADDRREVEHADVVSVDERLGPGQASDVARPERDPLVGPGRTGRTCTVSKRNIVNRVATPRQARSGFAALEFSGRGACPGTAHRHVSRLVRGTAFGAARLWARRAGCPRASSRSS